MFGVVLIVIGLVIGLVSGVFRTVPNQKRVYGKIVHLKEKGMTASGRFRYQAHVEYIVNGYRYIVKSKRYSWRYKVGARMIVAYNLYLPQEAFLCAVPGSTVLMLGFIFVGILWLLKAFLVY